MSKSSYNKFIIGVIDSGILDNFADLFNYLYDIFIRIENDAISANSLREFEPNIIEWLMFGNELQYKFKLINYYHILSYYAECKNLIHDTDTVNIKNSTNELRDAVFHLEGIIGIRSCRNKTVYVYFIQADNHYIKIGYSAKPMDRMKSMTNSQLQHTSMKLLAITEGGRKLEKELHDRFAGSRYKGEWFNPTEELLQYISSLPSGEL